jgi:hypothetical protein
MKISKTFQSLLEQREKWLGWTGSHIEILFPEPENAFKPGFYKGQS